MSISKNIFALNVAIMNFMGCYLSITPNMWINETKVVKNMNDTIQKLIDIATRNRADRAYITFEYDSKINNRPNQFLPQEGNLRLQYEVFKYYHEHNDFSLTACSKETGIDYKAVKEIFDKYFKTKQNGKLEQKNKRPID